LDLGTPVMQHFSEMQNQGLTFFLLLFFVSRQKKEETALQSNNRQVIGKTA